MLLEKLCRSQRSGFHDFRVNAATEPRAGFAEQVELPGGFANADEVEAGGFEEDGFGRCGDLGIEAAHDTCQGNRTGAVRDQQVVSDQFPFDAIERFQLFA